MTIQSSLSGKTALVTGASRGIGRATALALAQAGAQVIVHYSRGEKEATAVVSDIRDAGGKAEKVTADLRMADGPHLLAERVRAIIGGRMDILVANAGISKTDAGQEFTLGIQALKRLATPEEIAAAITFLASDQAQWITGDTLRVDGGSKL